MEIFFALVPQGKCQFYAQDYWPLQSIPPSPRARGNWKNLFRSGQVTIEEASLFFLLQGLTEEASFLFLQDKCPLKKYPILRSACGHWRNLFLRASYHWRNVLFSYGKCSLGKHLFFFLTRTNVHWWSTPFSPWPMVTEEISFSGQVPIEETSLFS